MANAVVGVEYSVMDATHALIALRAKVPHCAMVAKRNVAYVPMFVSIVSYA